MFENKIKYYIAIQKKHCTIFLEYYKKNVGTECFIKELLLCYLYLTPQRNNY